ncbi:hypothetical protein CVS40_11598 [Lucilia cuprina]|nr:hypothetical protein CVS40_11598 [Lucilia cuprina]
MCEIESIINSRPLTFVSIKHEDDDAITPNHLLLSSCDGYKPFFEDNKKLWHQTQLFADHFWQRWLKEYASVISRRSKWFSKVPPVSVGAIVIVVDENLPQKCWPKGKVIDIVVAADGQVRRVTIKTQFGVMQIPVTKVAVLNVGDDHEQACGGILPPSTIGLFHLL